MSQPTLEKKDKETNPISIESINTEEPDISPNLSITSSPPNITEKKENLDPLQLVGMSTKKPTEEIEIKPPPIVEDTRLDDLAGQKGTVSTKEKKPESKIDDITTLEGGDLKTIARFIIENLFIIFNNFKKLLKLQAERKISELSNKKGLSKDSNTTAPQQPSKDSANSVGINLVASMQQIDNQQEETKEASTMQIDAQIDDSHKTEQDPSYVPSTDKATATPPVYPAKDSKGKSFLNTLKDILLQHLLNKKPKPQPALDTTEKQKEQEEKAKHGPAPHP